jgi:hypothetical protein
VEPELGIVEDGEGDGAQEGAQDRDTAGQVERRRAGRPKDGGEVQEDEAEDQAIGPQGEGERREGEEQVEVVDGGLVAEDVVVEQRTRVEPAAAHLERAEEVGVSVLEVVEEQGLADAGVENEKHRRSAQQERHERTGGGDGGSRRGALCAHSRS